ncbi:MAG: hypothetical protein ACK5HR_00785 [Mycoplasmatales bacterium]
MEFKQYIKSRRGIITTIIYFLIVCLYIVDVTFFPKFEEIYLLQNFFTSTSPETSMKYAMLLLWFLPVWLYQIYIYVIQTEFNKKYDNLIISKVGSKKYYLKKIFSAFYIVFLIMFTLCILSIFVTYLCGYITGIDLKIDLIAYHGKEILVNNNLGAQYELLHPLASLIFHYLILAFSAGILASVMTSLTFIFKNMKVTLCLSLILWYYFVSSTKFNIMIVIQPFIYFEYSLVYSLITIVVFSIIAVLINVVAYIYISRRDNV